MRITFVPHALRKMAERGISEEEVRLAVSQPEEQGLANVRRLYAQKEIGHRRIRIVYNRGADEIVVVSAMLRRKEGERT